MFRRDKKRWMRKRDKLSLIQTQFSIIYLENQLKCRKYFTKEPEVLLKKIQLEDTERLRKEEKGKKLEATAIAAALDVYEKQKELIRLYRE